METVIIGNHSYSKERTRRLRQSAPTLSQALNRYLEEITPKKRNNRNSDRTLKRAWDSTPLSGRLISAITQQDLAKYRDLWLENLAPGTVVRRLSIISHLYTVAIKDWGMSYISDPSKLLRRPIVKNARDRRIIDNISLPSLPSNDLKSEVGWIISNTKSEFLPFIVTLALETAMRRSEISNILKEDINFKDGYINLPITKNGKPRKVPLSPWAKYSLVQYITGSKNGRVFDLNSSAITKAFNRAIRKGRVAYREFCQKVGVEPDPKFLVDLRFHDLRHEATSRLATIYEMHELAKITGHSDTRSLLRYYHPDIKQLTSKLANSPMGVDQFNRINDTLLSQLRS